ncbi:NFX1-type zinc finger-containing protein 1-like isoform X1 [Ptychodera flava]
MAEQGTHDRPSLLDREYCSPATSCQQVQSCRERLRPWQKKKSKLSLEWKTDQIDSPNQGDRKENQTDCQGNEESSSKEHEKRGARKKETIKNKASIERGPKRGKLKQLNFERLTKLYEADPREIVMTIAKEANAFIKLIDEQPLSDDDFRMTLRILRRAITCSTVPQSVIHILILVSECNFFKVTVPRHLSSIMVAIQRDKFDGESEATLRLLVAITKNIFRRMPGKFKDLASTLNLIIEIVRMLEKTKINIDEDIKEEVQRLEEDINAELKNIREGVFQSSSHAKFTGQKKMWVKRRPTEDFREIPIFPRQQDVVTDSRPFIRPNKPKGSFEDVNDYLDIQFRLLREDFIAPLRDGVGEILRNLGLPRSQQQRLSDVRMYINVHILQPVCMENEGICHEVSLDKNQLKHVRWNYTKRLLYGGLVCLTKDNFKTVMFATVANRNIDQLKRCRVILKFHSIGETLKSAPENSFIMVETTAYFEANRYVLAGLQELDDGKFPFEKYIVHCESIIGQPQYLHVNDNRSLVYDFAPLVYQNWKMHPRFRRNYFTFEDEQMQDRFPVHVLDTSQWPTADCLGLNESQLKALKTALTEEFVVIQGPPGTGKTHVGLKIMRMLLPQSQPLV